ncbi:excalibur calcium-binding domain-containing protein [Saccharothrix deserti]|uniref:excalibur calcium-binding domain-containing protein n=1 Tax=Saccharothrix deserti TaxID=2593674 RepID=UPI00131B6AEA|nr:excalibur calcium-binding domain-containing protein [Saccharothrix deserti]
MSSGRSVALAGVALLLATGTLVTVAMTANEPRPVDVRRVDASPAEPGVLSATYTTTIEAARSTTPVVVFTPTSPRPAPLPPSAVTTTTTTTTEPPPPSSSAPESTTPSSSRPPWGENCDHAYVTDGVCVPWRFPHGVWQLCEWLHDQGVTHIVVEGWDRHHLDLDRDGIACERAD